MQNINKHVVAEFLVVATVLCSIGYFTHCMIKTRLNDALEDSVSRHIGTVSYTIENTIKNTFRDMHIVTGAIEHGDLNPENTATFFSAFEEKTFKSGIIRADSSPIGENYFVLSPEEFNDIQDVFYGEDVLSYHGAKGMTFAVPVVIDGETCAFYQHYSKENLVELFSVVSYDGEGRITLANPQKEWIEITKSVNDALYDELYKAPGFAESYYEQVGVQLLHHKRAVSQYEYNGITFVRFGAVLGNGELALFGIVKRDAVSAGIEFFHIGFICATVAICLILITYARAAVKSAENKELKIAKESAIQASKTKSEFLSNMSHEIRTPINAVLGMNEMILREAKDETILEYAENIKNAGNNLLGIVNDILDFSKIEAGKMEIIPVEYELSSLLNDLVNMIQKRAENKGLELIVNADENLPTILFGDEIRIKQVVTNILTNAVKYTERGSVTLKVEILQKSAENITIRFSVKDTGIGIKPEDIKKLFSAFERIEEKRNRTIEGTGLGMNITQRLLIMMGSDLKVDSVYGEGSNFYFDIDQKIINAAPIGNFAETFRNSLKQHKEYHEKFTAPNAKILVVDDTPMNLTVVKGLLKQTKIQIDTAESGFKCLELVEKNLYDIIFLDHRMPEMDGIETLQEMKKLPVNPNADTPVISLTANAISGAREKYIAAGFQDYLTKPINSVKLEELIMKYLPPEKIQSASEDSAVEEKLELPDWLAQIGTLNAREGVEHCGDIDSYIDALKVFANSILSNSDEIEKFYNAGDWKNYTTKVHALKSSARVIGANELSEKARRLEDAGNSGYINEIQQDTAPLLKLYRSYAEKLSPLIEVETEENNSDKPPIEEDSLAEAYETMKEAAASFDIDTIEFVLQSLEDYQLPAAELERYKKIKDAVAKLDWDLIKAVVKRQ